MNIKEIKKNFMGPTITKEGNSEYWGTDDLLNNSEMKDELLQVCLDFINENGINCPEAIYQSDRVILNAQEFIEKICDVVGYCEVEEEP